MYKLAAAALLGLTTAHKHHHHEAPHFVLDKARLNQPADVKTEELAQIYQGLMEAYGAHIDVFALLICVREEDQAVLMFDLAAKMIAEAVKTKDYQSLIGAVIAIVGGVQQFKKGLPACEAIVGHELAFEQLEHSMSIAANPIEKFEVLKHDVTINGKSILADAERAAAAYEKGDYETFGKSLGEILRLATEEPKETNIFNAVATKSDNRTIVAEVAEGFLEAMKVGTFNFTNLLICIYQADQAALILYELVGLLEDAIKTHNVQDLIGVGILGFGFVQQLKQTLPVCEAVDTKSMDWTNVNQLEKIMEDPEDYVKQVGKNILVDGVVITEDMRKALLAYQDGEYQQFGFELGSALLLATEGKQDLFLY
jgi:hypothetical protein